LARARLFHVLVLEVPDTFLARLEDSHVSLCEFLLLGKQRKAQKVIMLQTLRANSRFM
jgi:hypothetical protein